DGKMEAALSAGLIAPGAIVACFSWSMLVPVRGAGYSCAGRSTQFVLGKLFSLRTL
ncbi:hypothetical protein A2U01_0105383, partial [Trifolium medium]|nr:hypothetical protein [Trifolium medium]